MLDTLLYIPGSSRTGNNKRRWLIIISNPQDDTNLWFVFFNAKGDNFKNRPDGRFFLRVNISLSFNIKADYVTIRAEFFATLTDSLPVALAFRRIVSTTNNYVDNLSIEIESDCPHPTGVFLDSLETAAAHLSWSSTGAPFYRVITSHDGLDDTLFPPQFLAAGFGRGERGGDEGLAA